MKTYTEEEIKRINDFKSLFRTYFEGCYGFDAILPMSFGSFGITNLNFEFEENGTNLMVVSITLERVGLLIGKGGNTIDAITEYLNFNENIPIKINLIESKLWKFIKN